MTRALAFPLIGFFVLAAACAKPDDSTGVDIDVDDEVGGAGGTGPSAGTGGSTGGGAGQGTAGSGGGAAGTGGSTTPDAAADAPVSSDAASSVADAAVTPTADGAAASGDGSVNSGGEAVEGKPHIRLCPKSWSKQQCCEFLCSCLNEHCTDSAKDKPVIPRCMTMCMGLSDLRARCQVYHCFESNSPTHPQHHDSHCGHASGRVGGGSCTIITNQK